MNLLGKFVVCTAVAICPLIGHSQALESTADTPIRVCPGAFPTDLTATDCRYRWSPRTMDFVGRRGRQPKTRIGANQ